MDFELSPQQSELVAGVRDLTRRFDLDYWRRCDAEHAFPVEFWRALAAGGWLGLVVPPEHGGAGLGLLEAALVTEELAAGGGGIATTLVYGLTVVFAIQPIAREGTPEQRAAYLPGLLAGDIEACLAMTEPASGSDALKLQTRAERSGHEWEISGQKTFISGADRARLMLVVARTSEFGSRRPDGITLFLVDPRSPGVQITPIPKLGLNSCQSCVVHLDRVRVPPEAVVGEVGQGWRPLADVLNPERLLVTAGSLGTADLCLRLASDHARERIVFDRPLATYQGIAFPLAEAKARIDAARLLNLRAASRFDRGLPSANDCSEAKLVGVAAAWDAADRALQAMGGYGYTAEYHVERYWRDIRLYRLAPISEQLTMAQVAERVLGLQRSLSGQ